MNIKNIFITTGLSILFGMYSIYNIIEYLRIVENERNKHIDHLQEIISNTNKRYIDLNTKYISLNKKYDNLSVNYDKLNQEIIILNLKIIEMKHDVCQVEEITQVEPDIYPSSPVNTIIDSDNNSIICDELCDLNLSIPRIHLDTMHTNIKDKIDDEFIESLSLDYSSKNTVSLHRVQSISEINWLGLTKKFFLG